MPATPGLPAAPHPAPRRIPHATAPEPLEHRLRLLATHRASAVISLLDADGVIRYQSPSVKWLLGYRPEQLLGRPLAAFLHTGSRKPATDALRRMTHRGQLFDFWHFRFRNASGNTCWLRGEASNFLDDAGLRGIVVFWKEQ